MIHVDITKTGSARHRSGLTRVTSRLLQELGSVARPIAWPLRNPALSAGDWLLTAELFWEEERPGISEFLAAPPCRVAAIFHDAIPLQHPHITWPQSVARHASYMKLLSRCARIWAVSAASRDALLGFWRWQGVESPPPVEVLPLGADFDGSPRVRDPGFPSGRPLLFCLGIVEPRKNQGFLLDVCSGLWAAGHEFELHVAGRVNPHFGPPLVRRMKKLAAAEQWFHFHLAPEDRAVQALFRAAHATLFPTIAEGCGLPLLESLWQGVPCLASDLPALRENAGSGGCQLVAPHDPAAWRAALERILTDHAFHARLAQEAATRPLPTWSETADILRRALT